LPEVFVLSASLCCCCRVHLLHTILLLCFPFSGLHTHPTQQQQIDFSWNEKLCICICCWQNP
jgi:hypothetical protein